MACKHGNEACRLCEIEKSQADAARLRRQVASLQRQLNAALRAQNTTPAVAPMARWEWDAGGLRDDPQWRLVGLASPTGISKAPVPLYPGAPAAEKSGAEAHRVAAFEPPPGYVLIPLIPTRAMNQVMDEEDWEWADLLAAAEAVSEAQYNEVISADCNSEPAAQLVEQPSVDVSPRILADFVEMAKEAHEHWNKAREVSLRNVLRAMSGNYSKHDARADRFHSLLKTLDKQTKQDPKRAY